MIFQMHLFSGLDTIWTIPLSATIFLSALTKIVKLCQKRLENAIFSEK